MCSIQAARKSPLFVPVFFSPEHFGSGGEVIPTLPRRPLGRPNFFARKPADARVISVRLEPPEPSPWLHGPVSPQVPGHECHGHHGGSLRPLVRRHLSPSRRAKNSAVASAAS
jgi:hypothetical protein